MIQVTFSRTYYYTLGHLEKVFKDKFDITNHDQCTQQALELAKTEFEMDLAFDSPVQFDKLTNLIPLKYNEQLGNNGR